jgi:SPX domain protein involved in polyphosphate accumulation
MYKEELKADVALVVLYSEVWGRGKDYALQAEALSKLLGGIDIEKFGALPQPEQENWLEKTEEARQDAREELLYLVRDELDSSLDGFKKDKKRTARRLALTNDAIQKADHAIESLTLRQINAGSHGSPAVFKRTGRQIENIIGRSTSLRDHFQNLFVSITMEETKSRRYFERLIEIADVMNIRLRDTLVVYAVAAPSGD